MSGPVRRIPWIGPVIACLGIAVALGCTWFSVGPGSVRTAKSYYTTDDSSPQAASQSLFVDAAGKIVPFEKGGKQAYLAQVYEDGTGGIRVVSMVSMYTPKLAQELNKATNDRERSDVFRMLGPSNVLLKAPGGKEWIASNDLQRLGRAVDRPFANGQPMEIAVP